MPNEQKPNGAMLFIKHVIITVLTVLVGVLCRPLLMWLLKMKIKSYEKQDLGCKTNQCIDLKSLLLYNQKASWPNVLPVVDTFSGIGSKPFAANSFAYLYLANLRLTEAQEANAYCVDVTDQWVKENPAQAQRALQLWKRLASWYPFSTTEPTMSDEEFRIVRSEIYKVKGRTVKEWRDSRVAAEVIAWLIAQGDEEAGRLIKRLRLKNHPVMYQHLEFDIDEFEVLGIGEEELKEIYFRAEMM